MSDDPRVGRFERRPGADAGPEAPPRSLRTVTAILPNGRVLWLGVGPAPGTEASLQRVAHLAEASARRRRAQAKRQRAGMLLVARLSAASSRHVSHRLVARRRRLRRRVKRLDLRLDRRLARAREVLRRKLERQRHLETESVRRQHRRDLWDKAVVLTTLPLFAAYRAPGRPFAESHLALLLSSLLWLVGDDVVDAVFGPEEPSPYALGDLDIWSYIAPAGNLFGGYWLLGEFQHERFVAGVARIPPDAFSPRVLAAPVVLYEHAIAVDLSRIVAAGRFPDLAGLAEVPVVVTIRSLRFSSHAALAAPRAIDLSAQVIRGALVIDFRATAEVTLGAPTDPLPPVLESLEVAWMVDTAPRGTP